MLQVLDIDDEGLLGGDHGEVGVVPDGDGALAGDAEARAGVGREPPGDVAQLDAELLACGPHRRQPELNRGDASPCLAEVAGVLDLEVHGARRVVGGDVVDGAVLESLPQGLAVVVLAQRRAALVLGGAVGDELGGEGEVVRTGLDGDLDALLLGGADGGQGLGGGQVEDVHPGAGLSRGGEDLLDGGVLSRARPGGQEGGVLVGDVLGRLSQDAGVLGVDDEDGVELGELGEDLLDALVAEVAVLVDARVRGEALEPEDALVPQGRHLVDVARDGAAPEADVDRELALGGLLLGLKVGDRRRGRARVQRHVEDGGDASGQARPGGALVALPGRAAGLVDVHVGIDEPGHEDLVVGYDDLLPGLHGGAVLEQGGDALVIDDDDGRSDPVGEDRALGADDELMDGLVGSTG